MKIYLMTLLFTAGLLFGQSKAAISYSCDIVQGFNFQRDMQTDVGHVTYLKLGTGTELAADFSVTDPTAYPSTVNVVGVMSTYYWNGGVSDPVELGFNISTVNKQAVSAFLHASMTNTDVVFNYNVYSYDPDAKKYYTAAFNVEGNLLGIIRKEGGVPVIYVDDAPNEEVIVPQNYAMYISINPQAIPQELSFSLNETSTFTKQWGFGAPAIPALISPVSGSSTTDHTPTFDWYDTTGATSYTLLVDNNSDFSSPEINASPSASTYTPGTDMAGGTYYWKALATNMYGSSSYSDVWNFTIELPPPLPPGGIIIGPPRVGLWLEWDASAGATGYDIYSSDDPYGTYNFEAHVTVCEYEITPIGAKKFYYVVATN